MINKNSIKEVVYIELVWTNRFAQFSEDFKVEVEIHKAYDSMSRW